LVPPEERMTEMPVKGSKVSIQNRILATLPKNKYEPLLSSLQPVSLSLNQVLYEAGEAIRHVYFPNGAMVSLVAIREDGGRSLEVGVVGDEGMLGAAAFLGNPVALNKAVVQLAGGAMRARVDVLKDAAEAGGPLHKMLHGYLHVALVQITRSAICNRFHNLGERLARWLLITHDHAKADTFPMTHEFISNLLGVRRVDVTKSASTLQREGLINYKRGAITVIDREGLEEASCNCYRIVRDEIDRLHGD
jgi:CRP-like cAMP-binding protein